MYLHGDINKGFLNNETYTIHTRTTLTWQIISTSEQKHQKKKKTTIFKCVINLKSTDVDMTPNYAIKKSSRHTHTHLI